MKKMNDAKSFLLSKTLWGIVISALGSILPKVGLMPFTEAGAGEVAGMIVTVLGGLFAIYGRVAAQKAIKK